MIPEYKSQNDINEKWNYIKPKMKTFTENESYKHKMAKEVIKEWFYGGECIGDIRFWPNRTCGVWLEYPIVKNDSYNSIDSNWDEIMVDDNGDLQKEYVPTYEECVRLGIYPKRVIDVILTHKGIPRWFIEICHKNPTSQEKIDELKELGVRNLIEIDAEWIMKQTKKPSEIKYKRLI